MLEKVDLGKTLSKKEYKETAARLEAQLSFLQRECKRLNVPIMILFDGWGAAGKGTLINRLIEPLDPRGFKVYTIQKPSEEEMRKPFLWRFWTKTPAKGRIHLFDRSWYRKVLAERMDGATTKEELQYAFEEIVHFEKQLTDDGTIIIKFFLHISQKEQEKRFAKLENNKDTSWRVTKGDWKQNKEYNTYLNICDEMLEKTDNSFAPWTIVEATDRSYASAKILSTVADTLLTVVESLKAKEKEQEQRGTEKESADDKQMDVERFKTSALNGVDLSLRLEKADYKKKLEKLQDKLFMLHNEMYQNRIPVVLAFEGWDAGGKGGAIKRLTQKLDPRGYEVVPTASPNDIEKAHHYLWRFWNHMPKAGHLTIFDRTWYGRVMVERIEGFCTEEEWQRAYNEINQMEEHLTNYGCIVLKFWMHIDKDEQETRFKERQNNPEKMWKITEEDWRNRAKWKEYEEAVDEMIIRTSTTYAPWIIVEANSKYYARIKVLESVIDALEKRLQTIRRKS